MPRYCCLLMMLTATAGCTLLPRSRNEAPTVAAPVVEVQLEERASSAETGKVTSAAGNETPDPQPLAKPVSGIQLAQHIAEPPTDEADSPSPESAADDSLIPPAPMPEPDDSSPPRSLSEPSLPEPPITEQQDPEDLQLGTVIESVYRAYPLLDAARFERNVAAGEQLAAIGLWDLKIKAATENSPTGFYENFRQSVGVEQPTYRGGEVFAGYRIGRGHFEPWYKERQTDDAGEFKAGFSLPLAQDRRIDERRAALWRATYERQAVEPDINAQLIGFVLEGSYAYWDWVAAGAKFRIAQRVLNLAEERTERIRRQVEEGLLDPPELTDNLRLVAERRANLADAERELQQKAVKLSLYLRDPNGRPVIPEREALPEFPEPPEVVAERLPIDIERALKQRPELAFLDLQNQQLQVDFAQARNEYRPALDAVLAASQDMGEPATKKDDKGEFELDAAIFLDVPLQRRKARGKMQAVSGKILQVQAKRRMTADKIIADVRTAYAGLTAALRLVEQTQQAYEYAEELAQRERRNFELGLSDLLNVTLREQYAAEAAGKVVTSLLLYYQAQADYRAALGDDRL